MKLKFDWEAMDAQTLRAKVEGGWLVRFHSPTGAVALTMVPDPKHNWEVEISADLVNEYRERLIRLEHNVQDPYVDQNIREELKEEIKNLKHFLEQHT